jgi:GTP-binding protein YchF
MSLSIAIIGLPNVGKSTTFNALTKEQYAQVANYPFCTITPNKAIVPVPDERVEKLAQLAGVGRTIHTTIEFVDVAGLVKGASRGEGLGNQFLANIRDTDAIVHVVRCFEDVNVVHVSGQIEPRQDIEVVNLELVLADLQQLERKIERLSGQAKGDKKFRPYLEMAQHLQAHLQEGKPVSAFPDADNHVFQDLVHELRFLTAKPLIYAVNVAEDDLAEQTACVQEVLQVADEQQADVVKLCARLEEEMAGLTDDERQEFLELAGAQESGLEQVIHKSYRALDLITFFTMNEQEVRAWTVPQGTVAPKAAGVIHTDFERGFIRAEVIPYETFVRYGSSAAAKAAGEMRLEGKDYVLQDGDVIYFRFNV